MKIKTNLRARETIKSEVIEKKFKEEEQVVYTKLKIPPQTIELKSKPSSRVLPAFNQGCGNVSAIDQYCYGKTKRFATSVDLPKNFENLSNGQIQEIVEKDNEILRVYDVINELDNYLPEMGKSDIMFLRDYQSWAVHAYSWEIKSKKFSATLRKNDSRRKLLNDLKKEGHFKKVPNSKGWSDSELCIPKNQKAADLVWLMASGKAKGYDEIKVLRNADSIEETHSKAMARNV